MQLFVSMGLGIWVGFIITNFGFQAFKERDWTWALRISAFQIWPIVVFVIVLKAYGVSPP